MNDPNEIKSKLEGMCKHGNIPPCFICQQETEEMLHKPAQPADEINEDNVNDFFYKTGQEIADSELAEKHREEIKMLLGEWFEEKTPQAKERLSHFGVSEEQAEEVIRQIADYFNADIRYAHNEIASIKVNLDEIRPKLKDTPEINAAIKTIENLTQGQLVGLFFRKLKGETSSDDKGTLLLLDLIKHKGRGGEYQFMAEKVEFSLFNNKSLADYDKVLTHELTHYGLNASVPEAAAIQSSEWIKMAKDPKSIKPTFIFSRVLAAIDESAAHIAEGRTPDYSAYSPAISVRMFEQIHQSLKQAVAKKSQTEQDQIFQQIYSDFAKNFKEDVTNADIAQMVMELKSQFK